MLQIETRKRIPPFLSTLHLRNHWQTSRRRNLTWSQLRWREFECAILISRREREYGFLHHESRRQEGASASAWFQGSLVLEQFAVAPADVQGEDGFYKEEGTLNRLFIGSIGTTEWWEPSWAHPFFFFFFFFFKSIVKQNVLKQSTSRILTWRFNKLIADKNKYRRTMIYITEGNSGLHFSK